jgi:hypothetical protein
MKYVLYCCMQLWNSWVFRDSGTWWSYLVDRFSAEKLSLKYFEAAEWEAYSSYGCIFKDNCIQISWSIFTRVVSGFSPNYCNIMWSSFVSDLRRSMFSPGNPVSSTNKTDRHDIAVSGVKPHNPNPLTFPPFRCANICTLTITYYFVM